MFDPQRASPSAPVPRPDPVLLVYGTRPEVLKLSPVAAQLRACGVPVSLLFTGQHPDLAPALFEATGMTPDYRLALPAGLPPAQGLGAMLSLMPPLLGAIRPSMVVVQGDTVSALGGAVAASLARVPVAHVEAGLRAPTPTDPHPEELSRRLIAATAALHFAPTEAARCNLIGEGIPPEAIHLTGNTAIDMLRDTRQRLRSQPGLIGELSRRYPVAVAPRARPLLLVTVHRRETRDARLRALVTALRCLASAGLADILLPLHPGPAVAGPILARLSGRRGIRIVPPTDHAAMVWLMEQASLVLTDSGGLQEEAPALGRRTLILRGSTERPEAIACGASELLPDDPRGIVRAVVRALARPPLRPVSPFGDGHAGARIARILAARLHGRAGPALLPAASGAFGCSCGGHQCHEAGEACRDRRAVFHGERCTAAQRQDRAAHRDPVVEVG